MQRTDRLTETCSVSQRKVLIMNTKSILAIAAFAALASVGAQAGEADLAAGPSGQVAVQSQGTRTRAEVQAEAVATVAHRSTEPAGSRVAAPLKSNVEVRTIRAQAAEGVRLGQLPHGEAGPV
jgi:hypothetical protein